jgi:uncharacterized protein
MTSVKESFLHGRGRRLILALLCCLSAGAQVGRAETVHNKVEPKLESQHRVAMRFDGFIGDRLRANLENWELRVPDANPALVEMFYDRDRKPNRNLLPWSGEFAGKYLASSILSYQLLRDPRQKANIQRVASALLASQGPDGYLGPFSRDQRLTGNNWDIWGHYWVMRALLMYSDEFGSKEALSAVTRAADMLVNKYLNKGVHMTNDGSYGQMNYAVIHAFAQLYRRTGDPRYLDMAQWIVKEWDLPGAGLYLRMVAAGKNMFEFPGNRWESLHDFLGMYETYLLTGDRKLGDAFTHIWTSILKGDRHNTGGFTSGERTTGNPYDQGAIETCCTVAWIDTSIDMLKLTGDSLVADELELSTFNGIVGGQNYSGRWWTYNTPMDGTREAAVHTIGFQCRAGSPELNCCSVNGPRGLAMISQWAVMRGDGTVVLNYYGPSSLEAETPRGQPLTVLQQTRYPASGNVQLRLSLPRAEQFTLRLRIPSWSQSTSVSVNGETIPNIRPGTYLDLARNWKTDDSIAIDFDMSPHYWAGERELDGRTSIYSGPILLAFDPVYNDLDPDQIPAMDAVGLQLTPDNSDRLIRPWLLFKIRSSNGREVRLCDFATAGAYGNTYKTWLPIRNVTPIAFNRSQPVWNNRPPSKPDSQ